MGLQTIGGTRFKIRIELEQDKLITQFEGSKAS